MRLKSILAVLLLVNLSGCQLTSNISSTKDSSYIINKNSSTSSYIIDSSNTNSDTSIEKEEKIILDFYAINDFHGRISEDKSRNVPGIAKLATYLDNERIKNNDGYILINSGDFWQDTYESGYNKGQLLSECLDIMEFDAMVLGNHDFDWGVEQLKENLELASYTKFLGANIYEYPNTDKRVDFVEPYVIIERSGLKIGIIGVIGEQQLTSITSSIWENLTFKPHAPIVQELSDELRMEKDCDIVVLSIHADEADSQPQEISKVSPVSNKKYVDAVFCAHTHQREKKEYNGVPFIQAGEHGQNISHVKLEYNEGEVTVLSGNYEAYGLMNNLNADQNVQKIVDKYFDADFNSKKDKIIGTINGTNYIDSTSAGNLLAKATYDLLEKENIKVDIVINNGSRDSVSTGEMTSEKIFNMIPFTNKTIVCENILGQDIIGECIDYNNPYYKADSSLKIDANGYYTVACIDYMMLHKNVRREYNYFRSYNPENVIYTINQYCNEIVEDYLQEKQTININDYSGIHYSGL